MTPSPSQRKDISVPLDCQMATVGGGFMHQAVDEACRGVQQGDGRFMHQAVDEACRGVQQGGGGFMHQAVDEACRGVQQGDGGPFGAVVVRDGKAVAVGHNMVLVNRDPTAHAEMTAIRAACETLNCFDLSGCVLYTSCYPCPMCLGACLWARLDAIYYACTADEAAEAGFDDRAFHDFLKNPCSDQLRKLEQFTIDGNQRPFEMWTSKENRIPY